MLKKIALLFIVLLLFAGCEFGRKEEKGVENIIEITNTPEVTAEPQKASVINKLQYQKEVIIPEDYKDMENDFPPHKIFVPEIVDDGETVKSLNADIYAICKDYVDLLQRNGEDRLLVNISYEYTEKDGIFGILTETRQGVMYSEWWSTYHFFYYDSNENLVLNESEYYNKLGTTKDEIWQKVKTSTEFTDNEEFYQGATLDMAISDGKRIYAVINTPEAFSANEMITVTAN